MLRRLPVRKPVRVAIAVACVLAVGAACEDDAPANSPTPGVDSTSTPAGGTGVTTDDDGTVLPIPGNPDSTDAPNPAAGGGAGTSAP